MILCITCYSCDDPYKDTVFKVYDVQPAATYLQSRPVIRICSTIRIYPSIGSVT